MFLKRCIGLLIELFKFTVGKGVSADLPLFGMYQGARTLRLADGPDEVHRILIAKQVLKKYHQGLSWDFGI